MNLDHQKSRSRLSLPAKPTNTKVNEKSLQDKHIPVLLEEVLSVTSPSPGDALLDVTAGYGGHASAILERTLQDSGSVVVDRDSDAVKHLAKVFKGRKVKIVQSDFVQASLSLQDKKQSFDIILADLGVSSPHLDNPERGFSFMTDGPLDMRMDQSSELTAEKLINESSLKDLDKIIKLYGDEPRSRRIANAIVNARPLHTTSELAKVVERALRVGHKRVHPATKTFQAIRIAVNDELKLLETALPIWLELLNGGGRLAVISFHSLEDRMVKQFLSENGGHSYDARLKVITKKPVSAGETELDFNPRARSAKLRAAVKIKTTNKEGDNTNANTGKK